MALPTTRFGNGARTQAFSLIEVVLAIAVVAIAILSTVGLLSVTMSNFGSTVQSSVSGQIHDQVLHDVQQLAWTNNGSGFATVPVPTGGSYLTEYFDEQANLLGSGATAPPGTVYLVHVAATNAPSLPGGSAYTFTDALGNPSAATVSISIYHYPAASPAINYYTDYVSRN